MNKWEKFVQFFESNGLASSATPSSISVDVALTFLMFVGEGGREKHFFHVLNCNKHQSCDCPTFSSVNTIITYRSSLRQMFSTLFPLLHNPFDSLSVDCLILSLQHKFLDNRIPTKQAKALSESVIIDTIKQAEFDAVFERDKDKKWTQLRNILICKIMASFGCRASDVLRLRWADITINGDSITFSFFNTKTAMSNGPRVENCVKSRDVFKLFNSIVEWKPLCHPSFPFCLKKFRHLSEPPYMKSTVINKFVKLLFGEEFSSHSLRVSKACELARNHDDMKLVAGEMGMKSPVTAKRYSQQKLMISKDCSRKLTFG